MIMLWLTVCEGCRGNAMSLQCACMCRGRRQALDRGAVITAADKIATGHNADDIAETVLLNLLRGDVSR
jgi:tRNA(Ile)-lysidine synthase TilS/MesJ